MSEKEMGRHQSSLVDNCFEEGQYLQGIAYLDQLRLIDQRPSPAHVRQLIYIGLYPPTKMTERALGKRKEQLLGIASPSRPSRRAKSVQQRQQLYPPPEASEAAWRLLHEFVDTVRPEGLLRAIPCYPPTAAELTSAPRNIDASLFDDIKVADEEQDSIVSKEATKLCESKDCWAFLQPNFIRSSMFQSRRSDPFLDGGDDESVSAIGDASWPLLEWFVRLFERDKALVEDSADSYSVYLLSQIKPIPTSAGTVRIGFDSALDVVFACYAQPAENHKKMGGRLMAQLTLLGLSQSFSNGQFLTSTCSHMSSCPWNVLSSLLQDLPQSEYGLAFKITLCDRFLTQDAQGISEAFPQPQNVRSVRPQARKRRPALEETANSSPGSEGREIKRQKSQPWPVPTASSVLQHLKASNVDITRLTVLFHLVDAYGNLKGKIGTDITDDTGDQIWFQALRTNELEESIKIKFSTIDSTEEDKVIAHSFLTSLLCSCSLWRRT